jgi:PhzF family phenazine biosynthesis protein
MPLIPLYLVDAFTHELFHGNPAGVCLLQEPLADELMLQIAQEINASETTFLLPHAQQPAAYSLRFFTPTVEIDLCGHATLAAAHVVFAHLQPMLEHLTFYAQQDTLIAQRTSQGIALQFPLLAAQPITAPAALLQAFGLAGVRAAAYSPVLGMVLLEVSSREEVLGLEPDFDQLLRLAAPFDLKEVVVTSRDERYDFVSRCFCPWIGIPEDPVTGAAHALLAAYWQPILGKQTMTAYQASRRGGIVQMAIISPEQVTLTGQAVLVLEGQLRLP